MHRRVLAMLLARLQASATLSPQSTWPVRAGTEIRIETSTDRVFRGSLLEGSRDSIRLRQSIRDSIIAVPVTVVRTYSALRSNRGRGAKRGLLVGAGAALGLVAAITVANRNDDTAAHVTGPLLALPAALLGGVIGVGIGASLAKPEWSTPTALHASRRRALSLAISYRF